jgi:hypothetical protein
MSNMLKLAAFAIFLMAAIANWLASTTPIDVSPFVPTPLSETPGSHVSLANRTAAPTQDPAAYKAMIEQPLFNPLRRPAEQVVSEQSAAPTDQSDSPAVPFPNHIHLVGVIKAADGNGKALIRSTKTETEISRWLDIGADLSGWKITNISDRTVTVQRGSNEHQLTLNADTTLDVDADTEREDGPSSR